MLKGEHQVVPMQIFGFLGGVLTSAGFIPQIIKGFKTKRMHDVAIWQYILQSVGMASWLTYGLLLKDIPIIAANVFSLACALIILGLRVKYGKNEKAV